MFDWLFFIMINEQAALSRMLKCVRMEQPLDLFMLFMLFMLEEQWKQILLVMKIIGIVKCLLLFVYIHNKNKSLLFRKISPKIGCSILPSALISRSTKMHKLCIL